MLKIRPHQFKTLGDVPRESREAELAVRVIQELGCLEEEQPQIRARVHAAALEARRHGFVLDEAIERFVKIVLRTNHDLRPRMELDEILLDPSLSPRRKLERLEHPLETMKDRA